jgi:hypothetical protein
MHLQASAVLKQSCKLTEKNEKKTEAVRGFILFMCNSLNSVQTTKKYLKATECFQVVRIFSHYQLPLIISTVNLLFLYG